MARVFVAARPSVTVCDRLTTVVDAAQAGAGAPIDPAIGRDVEGDRRIRWVPPDQWHVTLRFWADHDLDAVARALDEAAEVGALDVATARFGPSVVRLGPTAVVVPVTGLDGLAVEVSAAIGGGPDRGFRGHLTLGRFRGRPRRDASHPVLGAPVTAECRVTEIELVESELGPAGARHRIVATWPLSV